MRKLAFYVAMLSFIFGLALVRGAYAETITGEVMDLACYTAHPDTGKGLSHAKCARQCLEKGIPAGILTQDGVLYVALGAEHGPANPMLIPYAGKVVQVEGEVKEMNGVKFVSVAKVSEGGTARPVASAPAAHEPSHEGHTH